MSKIKIEYLKIGDDVVVTNCNNTILEFGKKYKIKQIHFSVKFNKYYLSLVGNSDLRYKIKRFKLDIKTERKQKIDKLKEYESI